MDLLRKAGSAIRKFDDAYSEKISNFYADRYEKSDKSKLDMFKAMAGTILGGGNPSTRFDGWEVTPNSKGKINPTEKKMANVLNAVLPIESAIVKYALPAAGVTLAGKGLYDLTMQFGGAADRPEPNTLSMP